MLDAKWIRQNPQEVEKRLKTKDPSLSLGQLMQIDQQRRQLRERVEQLRRESNQHARKVAEKKRLGEEFSSLCAERKQAEATEAELNAQLSDLDNLFAKELSLLPNVPLAEVPISSDPQDNQCIKTSGPLPRFSFPPKNHLELNEHLHLFDLKRGAKLSGSGWPLYRGVGARLEWALINFMMETHVNNQFELWLPPLAGKAEILFGSAHLPKFESQLYRCGHEEDQLYLIPTSESVLNGLHDHEILDEKQLPLKYVAYTPCFRREAGATGTHDRGLIRTHQFNKVELFCITRPEESEQMLEQMVECVEKMLDILDIPYRRMLLVTGDSSFAAAKTIDIEVWLPGQNRYYEVSSLSNCTDFQARRAQIRSKKGRDKPRFVHTLNGSGVATSRLFVALLENYQQEDGSILLPKVLHKHMGGLTVLYPPLENDLRPFQKGEECR